MTKKHEKDKCTLSRQTSGIDEKHTNLLKTLFDTVVMVSDEKSLMETSDRFDPETLRLSMISGKMWALGLDLTIFG